jgi:ADP-ribose pyrophosphatase YjhB (NUDIX family)
MSGDMEVEEVRQGEWVGASDYRDLGNGYVAMPSWHITRDPRLPPRSTVGVCQGMDHTWTPKLVSGLGGDQVIPPQAQRCPAVTVDNFTLCYKTDGSMAEPVLVFGEFNKTHTMGGTPVQVRGLVLAAGGHYERMGARPDYFRDKGNVDLFDAAKAELMEEIGIDESGIVASRYIGCIDDCENDPRQHLIRHVVMRWIDTDPQESEELQRLVCIPLSSIPRMLSGALRILYQRAPLGLVLNHDRIIRMVLALPEAKHFIDRITAGGATGGGGQAGDDTMAPVAG